MTLATARVTRSSVLGKRAHSSHDDDASSSPSILADEPSFDEFVDSACASPDSPCAKRPRTSSTIIDGRGNKENIPPFRVDLITDSPRALRRTSTELTTPTRSRMTPRRHMSMSGIVQQPNTPAAAMSMMALQTPPTTPSSSIPLHSRVRALLRATCNSTADIAGRAEERATVLDFVTAFITSETSQPHPVLYISGSPGCGKTALVNAILSSLEVDMLQNEVNVAMVNCMALNGLDAVWDRLFEELGGSKKRGSKARTHELVEDLLSRRQSKCILILDEIDHVAASSQALITLFALAQTHSSVLRIIGIANTHTLTSSSAKLSLHGVSGVRTLHFSPYTSAQLLDILNTRLQSLSTPTLSSSECTAYSSADVAKFLPIPALTLLSKKIASQTGDVRALFEVLRGAIDRAVAQAFVDGAAPAAVTPTHILAALKAYSPASAIGPAAATPGASKPSGNSEIVAKIRNLGLHARLTLLALLLACKRVEAGLSASSASPAHPTPPRSPIKRSKSVSSGSSPLRRTASPPAQPSVDTTQLHTFYASIVAASFTAVSRSEFNDLAGVLETVGLVTLSSSSSTTSGAAKGRKLARTGSFGGGKNQVQTMMFAEGVRADEVLRGLGISSQTGAGADAADLREEQAAAIWTRELAKVQKEAKALNARSLDGAVGFDGAMED
ncbi:P-loop containing nucleoside triphosphate hydrolase protein [Auriscalpium vulgare]|uniref:P-loop containing nucleoside triphosphate hydrolase protein n=1 Tax=Auriscalpium vulgare TaxID=40419 RepID=A0ACB8RHC9_9AGAM|nr:P-loop containing nucleoside triphosphate hydrolase protein [Auriscalpium vulgare]